MTGYRHMRAIAVLLAMLPVTRLEAHGVFHERIAQATRDVEAQPNDAAPLITRAIIYVHHGQWNEAEADFRAAELLNPDDDALPLAWGQALGYEGRHEEAVARLSGYLGRHPDSAMARLARGNSLLQLGRAAAAAADFDCAVAAAANPGPDLYVQRGRACALSGDPARALAGLDDGIRRLGSVVNLELAAIEIQTQSGDFDGAVARLDRLILSAPRPETWLVRKGDVLTAAGRTAAASAAYHAALAALEQLPVRQRGVPATQTLEQSLRDHLGSPAPP